MDLRRGKQRKPLILAIFRGHLEEHAVMAWVEVHQREEETEGRAQVHPIWFTRGNYSKPPQWHCPVRSIDLLPPSLEATLADFLDCRRAASEEELFGRTSTDVGPVMRPR
jgi:hypothetical protein